jgi:uncharacterized metal-binding protein YceD (DUF177 family)
MKHSREFEIAWQGLKPGLHTYKYEIDDRFMALRTVAENFSNWDVEVTMKFDKQNSFFLLHFDIDGSVTAPCDRCGDDFKLRLWDEFDLVVKLTEEEHAEETNEDAEVVMIPRHETVIDITDWLYEFVMLSVPLQKIHPDKNGKSGCNEQALSLLNQLSDSVQQPKPEIWKGLDVLKGTIKNKRKTK